MPRAAVSVIIPNRNYGRFVADAIRSVLLQTHPVEAIVVDFGSTDGSQDVVRRFPVRLLEHDFSGPGGLARAFDAGLAAARGEYIVLLGADDLLHPEFVARTLAALQARPHADWAYTGAYLFGPQAPHGGVRFHAGSFSVRRLRRGNFMLAVALVRRSVYDRLGGYDPALAALEDWEFWLRAAQAGMHGVPVDEPLFYYRHHSPAQRNVQREEVAKAIRGELLRRHGARRGPLGRLAAYVRWRRRYTFDAIERRWPGTKERLARRIPGVRSLDEFIWIPVPAAETEPAFLRQPDPHVPPVAA